MYVTRKATGETATFWTMFLRETIGKLISGMIFSLGYLWIIFDRDSQGWHDKMAGTVVINK